MLPSSVLGKRERSPSDSSTARPALWDRPITKKKRRTKKSTQKSEDDFSDLDDDDYDKIIDLPDGSEWPFSDTIKEQVEDPTWFSRLNFWNRIQPDRIFKINPTGNVTLVVRKKVPVEEDVDGNSGQTSDQQKVETTHFICDTDSLKKVTLDTKWTAKFQTPKSRRSKVYLDSEDDVFGLSFMLDVAHGKNLDKYGPSFNIDELMHIVPMIHKYDATGMVCKALIKRIPQAAPSVLAINPQETADSRWLLIAWILSLEELFEDLRENYIRTCWINEDGQLLDHRKEPVRGYLPSVVVENIKKSREDCIENLLDLTYHYHTQLCKPKDEVCVGGHESTKCADTMCGNFSRGMSGMGLQMDRPETSDIFASVNSFKEQLKSILAEADDVNCQVVLIWNCWVEDKLKGIGYVPTNLRRHLELMIWKRNIWTDS